MGSVIKISILLCLDIVLHQRIYAEPIRDKILSYDVIVVVENNQDKPIVKELLRGEFTDDVKAKLNIYVKFNKKKMLMLFWKNGTKECGGYAFDMFGRVCDDNNNKKDCMNLDEIRIAVSQAVDEGEN